MRRSITTLALALSLATPAAVCAQASDPAAVQVQKLDAALLETMKSAKRSGVRERFQKLEPVVADTLDLAAMTRVAVGSTWATLPAAQQTALVRAFGRMTTATYAHNFDGYDGQKFTVEPQIETRGPDKLVRTHLVSPGSDVSLTYRMRQSGGDWKIVDIYYNGTVSSLLGQRSEFAATLRTGGAAALIQTLNARADKLLGS